MTGHKNSVSGDDLEQYEHIELTEVEVALALREARKAKHFQLKRQQYAEELKKEKPTLKLDVNGMWDFMCYQKKRINKEFNLDKWNRPIVETLCRYFTDDENKLDPNKGLLIFGHVGCGKTTLMRLLAENQKNSFRVVPCKVIVEKFKKAGNQADDVVNEYSRLYSNTLGAQEFKNGDRMGICFDDLGTEDTVEGWNKSNVMADIILRCYDNIQLKGNVHITTNLPTKQALDSDILGLKERYGDRVYSRLQEMFNVIEFPNDAPDYRTQSPT